MQRMYEEKKVLGRTGKGRSHQYHAAIQEDDIQQQLFDRLLDTAFKGSAMDMVMHALGHEQVSESELDELQQWLDSKKKGGKS
jgi:predicted transcriptional regulator